MESERKERVKERDERKREWYERVCVLLNVCFLLCDDILNITIQNINSMKVCKIFTYWLRSHHGRGFLGIRHSRGFLGIHRDRGFLSVHRSRGFFSVHRGRGFLGVHRGRGFLGVHRGRGLLETHRSGTLCRKLSMEKKFTFDSTSAIQSCM